MQVMFGRKDSAAGEEAQQAGADVSVTASPANPPSVEKKQRADRVAEYIAELFEMPDVEQASMSVFL
jgi:hypothetical protein